MIKLYIFQYNTGKISGTTDKYQFYFKLAETLPTTTWKKEDLLTVLLMEKLQYV